MSTTCVERILSRYINESDNPTGELRYSIYNRAAAIDDDDAEAALLAAIPSTYRGLLLAEYSIEPEESEHLWRAVVKYDKAKRRQTGDSEYSFDIGTQDVKIKQSITTTRYPSSAPDFKGAIGVTDKKVEGVEVKVPVFTFEETHYIDAADVDEAYKITLYGIAGKVNNAGFKGLAAGECLFLGASGTRRKDDQWAITFRFAGQPNVTGLEINGISSISKEGWEYLDVLYDEVDDTTANFLVKRPRAVYVHKIFETADFAGIGIGT